MEEGKKCEGCGKGMCGCPHHKMLPILGVLFGLLFLLGAYGWLSDRTVSVGWPLLVLVGSLSKLMGGKCSCC